MVTQPGGNHSQQITVAANLTYHRWSACSSSCRDHKQTDVTCWVEPQLRLGCDANIALVQGHCWVGGADESTGHGAVIAMTHAVVLQWGNETGSTVLPGILHLEVKTLCWGQSHYGLLHTALSVAHAHMQTQSQHHQDRVFSCTSTNPKSLGMTFHDLGLLSHSGNSGTIDRVTLSIWPAYLSQHPAYLSQHLNKYKLKSKRGRNQKSHSPINLLCNCKQAINYFVSWSVNKVSGFCSMGIYWCLLSLMPLNCKVLLDIWLPRHFRNAWLNYIQL